MYSKTEISEKLQNPGLVPVFYHRDLSVCKDVIRASYESGLRVFEYTNRGKKAFDNFPQLKRFVRDNCPGMCIGMGSILNAKQAELCIEREADFVVAPILDEDTARVCRENRKYWVPGCGTLSEIARARKLGADIIKIFPGSVLGPDFVKAVKAPMPHLKLMPTGGVAPEKENLKAWFLAGVACVGMGSKLFTQEAIQTPDLLKHKVIKTIEIINNMKDLY